MSDVNTRERLIASRLKRIVNELSGYPVEDIVDAQTFLDLGFDSLFLTQVATAFQNEFRTRITFRQLFEDMPSVAALARHLDATPSSPFGAAREWFSTPTIPTRAALAPSS